MLSQFTHPTSRIQALTNYAESIESYQRAIAIVSKPNPTEAESTLHRGYEDAVMDVKDKIMEPQTMYVLPLPIRHSHSSHC